MKIEYKIGDATAPDVNEPFWILHGCNSIGAWGSGFVLALNKVFGDSKVPNSPMDNYLCWFNEGYQKGDAPTLGDVQFVKITKHNFVVNMITQKGCGPVMQGKKEIGIPFRYEAFEECISRVGVMAERFHDKFGKWPTLVSPRIGCGLALAEWSKVESVILSALGWYKGTWQVYDLPSQEK